MSDVICSTCGATVLIGDWPWCPHGRSVSAVIGDDIPGGFMQEHFGDKPEIFYSKKAMAKRAKELGLVNVVKWSGPADRHLSRWV